MNPKVQSVIDGRAEFTFRTIDVNDRIRVRIFRDAIKVDGVRLRVSAREAQQIAYVTNCVLPTAAILDRVFLRSVNLGFKIEPTVFPMATWMTDPVGYNLKIDSRIDEQIRDYPDDEPLPNVGKHWVLDNLTDKNIGTNYGWHVVGNSFRGIPTEQSVLKDQAPQSHFQVKVIQGLGRRHDIDHVDYSQVCQLVHRTCELDGVEIDFAELIKTDPWRELCGRNVKFPSQPRVEEIVGIYVSPST